MDMDTKRFMLALVIVFIIAIYGWALGMHDTGTDTAIRNETVESFNRGSLFD